MMHSGEAMAGLRAPRPLQARMRPTGGPARTTLMTFSITGGSARGEAWLMTPAHALCTTDNFFNNW